MSQKSSYKAKVQKALILQDFRRALQDGNTARLERLFEANPEYQRAFWVIYATERG